MGLFLPVCVKCRCKYEVREVGVFVKDKEADGLPSTFWSGDLCACPSCGTEVVAGFGKSFGVNNPDLKALEFVHELPESCTKSCT